MKYLQQFFAQMRKLDELLANRRIPGEAHHRRMDPSLQEELAATDPSIEEVRYAPGLLG